MATPVFTQTLQICVVVRDIEKTMRTYVHDYGIGPWDIYDFNPGTVSDMHEGGKPVERSFRLALAMVGQLQWELIQPLDEESIYATFLAEHGEGIHHVGVATPDYEETIATLRERGHEVLFGGHYNGVSFAYLSTDRDMGLITEIFSAAPGEDQKPDAVYPPAEQ
jgi:methylmalonyl-CoA/ethylmalonyl-CoA epimerase